MKIITQYSTLLSLFLMLGCNTGSGSKIATEAETETTEIENETKTDTTSENIDIITKSLIVSQLYDTESYIFEDWTDLYRIYIRTTDVRSGLNSSLIPEGGLTDDTRELVRLKSSCEIGTFNLISFTTSSPGGNFITSANAIFFDFYGVVIKSQEAPLTECPENQFRNDYWHGEIDFSFTEGSGVSGLRDDYHAEFGNYPNLATPEYFISYSGDGFPSDPALLSLHGEINYTNTPTELNITSPYMGYRGLSNGSPPAEGYDRESFEAMDKRVFKDYNINLESNKLSGTYSRTYATTLFWDGGFVEKNFTIVFSDIDVYGFDESLSGNSLKGVIKYDITLHGENGQADITGSGQVNYNGDYKDMHITFNGVTDSYANENVGY